MTEVGKWVMVRLRRETHARLQQAIRTLCAAMESGAVDDARTNTDNSNPACLGITMDAMITRLLNDRDRHRVRVRKARKMKRLDEREGRLAEERGE